MSDHPSRIGFALTVALLLAAASGCAARAGTANDTSVARPGGAGPAGDTLPVVTLGYPGDSCGSIPHLEFPNAPKLPAKMMVYRVRKPTATIGTVARMAKRLGIRGPIKDSDEAIGAKDSGATLLLDKGSGSLFYSVLGPAAHGSDPLRAVLKDTEYRQAADRLLRELDLMKPGVAFNKVSKAGTFTRSSRDRRSTTSPTMIAVYYRQEGPSGADLGSVAISVEFGEAGKVTGLRSNLLDVAPLAEYPLIDAAEVVQLVEAGKDQNQGTEGAKSGVVDSSEVIYNVGPPGDAKEYLVPHILMRGRTDTGSGFTSTVPLIPERFYRYEAPPSRTLPPMPGYVGRRKVSAPPGP